VIVLENVSKSYFKEKEIKILNNINYKFNDGKLYCIMGKSGSGKTTLIQLLGLLLKQDEGNIVINNRKTTLLNDDDLALIRNKEIGFIFQSFYLNPLMKAYENVMLPCYLDKTKSLKDIKEESYFLLSKLGLSGREKHYPKELSGGEKQRVAIARALCLSPEILCFDEPTSALDPELTGEVLKVISGLRESGTTMLIVTHEIMFAREVADKVIFLDGGTILEYGDAKEVIDNPTEQRTRSFMDKILKA